MGTYGNISISTKILDMDVELLFPKVYQYLKIGATLPVTVASVERSFSTLKRLKSYLRNSTGENRLNGLAHLSIHREIPIQSSEVVDIFSEKIES